MNILLVIPPDKHLIHRESVIPLGIAYINGALRGNGINVFAYNLNYAEDRIDVFLEKVLREHNIEILLCGGTSYNYWGMKLVFDLAKKINNRIITIGGGAGYTSNPLLFAEMTQPDYVVLGEGEITTCELIRCLENNGVVSNVLGIMYKSEDGYVQNAERPLISDISSIPFPSYEGLSVNRLFEDLNDYNESIHFDYESVENPRVLPMLFGRSCPYGCSFCFHTIGRKYRARSLDNFFEELNELVDKYDLSGITIMDEFFGVKEDVIYEFCDRIKKYNLKWFAELRVDIINDRLIKKMKDAGCTNILIGLESMDDGILTDMKKGIKSEQSEKALAILYENGITISGNFIAVTPEETIETFYKTFDWWNQHRQYSVNLVHLQLCPGTDYYNRAVQGGVITDEKIFIEQGLPELNCSKLTDYEWDKVCRILKFTRMDGVMNGRMKILSNDTDGISCSFTCRHCSNEFTKVLPKIRGFKWKKYTFKCPECEHKSMYRLHDDSNEEFENEIMRQQIMNYEYGIQMSDWLNAKNYKNVILYGHGYNLMLMKKEIEKVGGEVKGFVYHDEPHIKVFESIMKGRIISESEVKNFDEDDVVIICMTTEYNEIFKRLRRLGFKGKIDSMVNAVLQHDYFIEENVW